MLRKIEIGRNGPKLAEQDVHVKIPIRKHSYYYLIFLTKSHKNRLTLLIMVLFVVCSTCLSKGMADDIWWWFSKNIYIYMKDDQDNSGMEIAQINDKMSTNKAFNWQTQDICCNDRKSDNLPRRETRLTFDKHLSWLCMKLTRGGIHKPRGQQTGSYLAKNLGFVLWYERSSELS